MASIKKDCKPMAVDNDNQYQFENAVAPVASAVKSAAEQKKYPILVVKNCKDSVTKYLIKQFFGHNLIQAVKSCPESRGFIVYFKNFRCYANAIHKLAKKPNIIDCIPEGRQPMALDDEVSDDDLPTPSITERPDINLSLRTINISDGFQKHPVFYQRTQLTQADYTAMGSLLAIIDPNHRFLNVKYEFALERYGGYVGKAANSVKNCILYNLSGRSRYIPHDHKEGNYIDINSVSSLIRKARLRKCVACELWTAVSCMRCNMPCCHKECLDYVREEHAKTCDTDKEIARDNTLMRDLAQPKMLPSGSMVKITAFQQTNVCYVVSTLIEDEIAYNSVLQKVMMEGKSTAQLEKSPELGQMVLYKFKTEIIRGIVINNRDPTDIYVVCIDYGNVEVRHYMELYECNADLADLPNYPFPVLLRGVPNGFLGPDIREAMYDLSELPCYKLMYSENEYDSGKKMHVAMLETENRDSLNRILKDIMKPLEMTLPLESYKMSNLTRVPLPTGTQIDLAVMDNSQLKCGIIYCTAKNLAYDVTKLQKDLENYAENSSKFKRYNPPVNELCLAKYRGKWCRGVSMEQVGDEHPSIFFLDYGNIVPIYVNDIRPYPDDLMFPIMTTELELTGMPENPTEEQVQRLEEYLSVGSYVTCHDLDYSKESNTYTGFFDAVQAIFGRN